MSSVLLYLNDLDLLACDATVMEVDEAGKRLLLDQTPFYPQGGGQQSDKGLIQVANGGLCLTVVSVKKDPATGQVWHAVSESVSAEDLRGVQVHCQVDAKARHDNSRSHSAGHALDHGIEDLQLPLEVRGACHFLPNPYVEYEFAEGCTAIPAKEDLPGLARQLEDAANAIIARNVPITIYDGTVAELAPWRQALLPEAVRASGRGSVSEPRWPQQE